MYVALSRVTSLDGLFLIGNYSSSAIRCSENATKEYERLRSGENLLEPLPQMIPANDNLVLTMLNIRSLRHKSATIKNYKELQNSDVLFFTETQISRGSNFEEVEYNMLPFRTVFNNDVDKYKSLAIGYKDSITILEEQHLSGFSLLKLRKDVYSDEVYKILLIYRSHQERLALFFDKLTTVLREEPDIDIVLGDFNIDQIKESPEKQELLNRLIDFNEWVTIPTHVDGGAIDLIFTATDFDDPITFLKYSTNLSDHDMLKIKIG